MLSSALWVGPGRFVVGPELHLAGAGVEVSAQVALELPADRLHGGLQVWGFLFGAILFNAFSLF